MKASDELERLVQLHGEDFRRVIADALSWLDEKEEAWKEAGIEVLDVDEFIQRVLRSVLVQPKWLVNGDAH